MNTTRFAQFFVPLLASLPCLPCAAQEQAAHTAERTVTVRQAKTFVLDVGTHEVGDLIDQVAAFLDYNILYDQGELAHATKIRITRRTEVDAAGCWELFGSLLHHKGLAILPLQVDQGFHQVVAIQGQRGREISSSAQFVPYQEVEDYARCMATPIQTTVPLQNINATIATNALRPFFAATGAPGNSGITLGNAGNNSSLLLQGYGHQVAAAVRLLSRVDVGDGDRSSVHVVRLEHANAEELAARVDQAFQMRNQQLVQAQGVVAGPSLRVVAHPTLNSLILVGTDAECQDAMSLVARLDLPAAKAPVGIELLQKRLEALEQRVAGLERAVRGGQQAQQSGK